MTELWRSQNGYSTDRQQVPFSRPGYVADLTRLIRGAGIGTRATARRTFMGTVDSAVARVVNAVTDVFG